MNLSRTIPAMPNWFPYNELLLSGKLFAKTRNWKWKHVGPTLLYTSRRTDFAVAACHGLDVQKAPRGVIVGIGYLLPVRPLTVAEKMILQIQFANHKRHCFAVAGTYLYKFYNLMRFRKPIAFAPPRGAVTIFNVPINLVQKEVSRWDRLHQNRRTP